MGQSAPAPAAEKSFDRGTPWRAAGTPALQEEEEEEEGEGRAQVPRLLVWFDGEDPFVMCDRICKAIAARDEARRQIGLQLAIECVRPSSL